MATIFALRWSESTGDPVHSGTGVGDTENVGIDLISSKYEATVVNTNAEFLFKCHDHWLIL